MKFRRHKSLDQPMRNAESEGPTLLDRTASSGAGPDRGAIGSELQVRLAKAIDTLREDQREVFLMREYGNLPFKEIAEVVGVPENTVKSRMRYALEHLRKQLARNEPRSRKRYAESRVPAPWLHSVASQPSDFPQSATPAPGGALRPPADCPRAQSAPSPAPKPNAAAFPFPA